MNKIHKTLLITSSLLLVIGAGCTQSTTNEGANKNSTNVNDSNIVVNDNTNEAVAENTNAEPINENTNEVVENSNVNVADNNTNTSDDTTVDTSDWLTYNNTVHGFSVSYPSDWKVETGRDEDNEPILDDTDTGFFVTYALPAWKHQDFTPGISIVFETDENFSELKKRLEKNNHGSIETKIDGYSAIAYNQLEIVYEQITLIPKKK